MDSMWWIWWSDKDRVVSMDSMWWSDMKEWSVLIVCGCVTRTGRYGQYVVIVVVCEE